MIKGISLILLLFLDLSTKFFFYDLAWGEHFSLLQPLLNTGISRGMSVGREIVLFITVCALFLFAKQYQSGDYKTQWGIVFLIAGGIGNFVDRIIYDGVRDFLVFPGRFVFNFADVWISVGVVFLVFSWFSELKPRDK